MSRRSTAIYVQQSRCGQVDNIFQFSLNAALACRLFSISSISSDRFAGDGALSASPSRDVFVTSVVAVGVLPSLRNGSDLGRPGSLTFLQYLRTTVASFLTHFTAIGQAGVLPANEG